MPSELLPYLEINRIAERACNRDLSPYEACEWAIQEALRMVANRAATAVDWIILLKSAQHADWQQVVMNGGPPCFAIFDDKFCLRAERWAGHPEDHAFVSLERLLGALQEKHQDLLMNYLALRSALAAEKEKGRG